MYQLCHTHRRRRRPKVVGDDNGRAWVIICATQLKQCDKFGRHNQHRNTFLRSERASEQDPCLQAIKIAFCHFGVGEHPFVSTHARHPALLDLTTSRVLSSGVPDF